MTDGHDGTDAHDDRQAALAASRPADYSDLRALYVNCTLKRSPEVSNTQALLDRVAEILHGLDCETETVRVVDYHVPFGIESDLGDGDEWPQILDKILAADILIIGTSIWFGVRSSVCQMVIERLDGTYNSTNEVGQYPLYNTVGGVVVTGNEDGAHDAAGNTLFNLVHLGCTIPPNADCYWVGARSLVRRRRRLEPKRLHPQDGGVDGPQPSAHGAHPEGPPDPPGGKHNPRLAGGEGGGAVLVRRSSRQTGVPPQAAALGSGEPRCRPPSRRSSSPPSSRRRESACN
jgi:multimeric flavodoxin WrbA